MPKHYLETFKTRCGCLKDWLCMLHWTLEDDGSAHIRQERPGVDATHNPHQPVPETPRGGELVGSLAAGWQYQFTCPHCSQAMRIPLYAEPQNEDPRADRIT